MIRNRLLKAALGGILGLASCAAQAQLNYNGFGSTSGLTLVGSAGTAATGDGTVLRLTSAVGSQTGAAYSTTGITLGANDTFSTQFQFRFTHPGGIDPADGITFVLAASPTGLGSPGIGIGYQGVPHSVAIEFDTYNNAGYGIANNDGNSSNHVAIDTNGALTNTDLVNVYGNASCGFPSGSPSQNANSAAGCMSNGDLWTAHVGYDGSKLSVTLSDPAEGTTFTAYSQLPIDIAADLGTTNAFVGFTSGTGAGWENHDIVNWQFSNTTSLGPPPPSSVPEPATVTLLAAHWLYWEGGVCASARYARDRPSASPARGLTA